MTNNFKTKMNKSQRQRTNDEPLILYLDTSISEANLAIFYGDEKIAEEKWEAGRELSKTLTVKYVQILSKVKISSKDLSGVAVFVGPGSFTGLRIGISFANGLGFALSIPVFEVKERGKLDLKSPKKIALPNYGSEPNITKPKDK